MLWTALFCLFSFPVAWSSSYADFIRHDSLPTHQELPSRALADLALSTMQWTDPHTRQRLGQLFEHYVYGHAPATPTFSVTTVLHKRIELFDGIPVDYWDLDLTPELPGTSAQSWRLSLFLPVGPGQHPLILALNKCGNHTVVHHPEVIQRQQGFQLAACQEAEFTPSTRQHFWNVHLMVARGYGFATLHESDIAPDDPLRLRERAMAHYLESPFTGEHAWGALAAWGWGLRGVAGYLRTRLSVDPRRIVTTGHSRRGKAALLAAAFDERIAATVPQQSGFLGMALARRAGAGVEVGIWNQTKAWLMSIFRENIFLMNRNFPHWLTPYAQHFAWHEDHLPVDQHLLLALVAPRPVLGTEGLTDYWSNYPSSLLSLHLAATQREITPDHFRQLRYDTGHTLNANYWKGVLDFLDQNLKPIP